MHERLAVLAARLQPSFASSTGPNLERVAAPLGVERQARAGLREARRACRNLPPPPPTAAQDKCASGSCTFAERLFFGRPAVPLKLEFAERWRAGTVDDSSGTFAAAPFGWRAPSQKETSSVPRPRRRYQRARRRVRGPWRPPHCECGCANFPRLCASREHLALVCAQFWDPTACTMNQPRIFAWRSASPCLACETQRVITVNWPRDSVRPRGQHAVKCTVQHVPIVNPDLELRKMSS
ncbi:hypothetical protein HPB50_020178 [Hyalomma asiaticum]|uniref:Uncharacterized protein n=1 Tax=Hyalomma asiaticum TaxID=266040 RepID=A0ACB7TNC5_HYAAI|nr:hypothetical protein HPB50_020178 [Hyalomma asiaticum]